MELKNLKAIEKWNLFLGAVLLFVVLLVDPSPRFLLGVGVGVAIAIGNFHAIRRIVEWGTRRAGSEHLSPGILGVALIVKMGLLMAAVALVLRFLPVHPIAFLLGISVFLVSILLESLRFRFARVHYRQSPTLVPTR